MGSWQFDSKTERSFPSPSCVNKDVQDVRKVWTLSKVLCSKILYRIVKYKYYIVKVNDSPDLSPLDFFFWVVLTEKVYSTKIPDSIHLTQRIKSEFTIIDGNADLLHRVYANFVKRIDICIVNDGADIEDDI